MSAPIRRFVAAPLSAEMEAALARIARGMDVIEVAVMPDAHLAEDVCVGTVIATTATLYPAAVGGDIGCGMLAERFDVPAARLDDPAIAARILDGLYARIPRDRRRREAFHPLPAALDPEDHPLSAPALTAIARREGRAQLGTLGSGNHFVELQEDEEGALWLMLHSGSRGLGPAIRAFHEARAAPVRGELAAIPVGDDAGCAYLADHDFALRWAAANRDVLAAEVAAVLGEVLGAAPVFGTRIACHHNHVRREGHFWVHRKGAMSAGVGEPGVIPGSMGSPSFHVAGRGCAAALSSASHGAGRAMSRGEARRRIGLRTLQRELHGVFYDHRRADQLRDEAPSAYKPIGEVMRAQHDLVRVVRRLTPRLGYKA